MEHYDEYLKQMPGHKPVDIPILLIDIINELVTIRAEVKETRKLTEEIHNMCQGLIYV